MSDRVTEILSFILMILIIYGIYRLIKIINRERFRKNVYGTRIAGTRVNIFKYTAYRVAALSNRRKLVREMCEFIKVHGGPEYIRIDSPFACFRTYNKTSNTTHTYVFNEHGYENPISFDVQDIFRALARKLHCKYKDTWRTEEDWRDSGSVYISGGTTVTSTSGGVRNYLICIELYSPQQWIAYQNKVNIQKQEQKEKDNFYKKI